MNLKILEKALKTFKKIKRSITSNRALKSFKIKESMKIFRKMEVLNKSFKIDLSNLTILETSLKISKKF